MSFGIATVQQAADALTRFGAAWSQVQGPRRLARNAVVAQESADTRRRYRYSWLTGYWRRRN